MGSLMALGGDSSTMQVSSKPKLLLWNDKAKKQTEKTHLLIRSPAHFLSVRLQMTAAVEVMRTGRIHHRLFFFFSSFSLS